MTYLSQLRRERDYVPLKLEMLDYYVHLDEALKNHMVLNAFNSQMDRTVLLQKVNKYGNVVGLRGFTNMDSLDNALRIVTAQYLAKAPFDQPRCDFASANAMTMLDLWIVTGGKLRAHSPDSVSVQVELVSADKKKLFVMRSPTFEEAYYDAEDYLSEVYQ